MNQSIVRSLIETHMKVLFYIVLNIFQSSFIKHAFIDYIISWLNLIRIFVMGEKRRFTLKVG